MVQAVRRGASMRQVAHQFGVALATVQRWVERAQGQRLDRVDWTDHPCGLPTPANRTERQREDLVLTIRQELRTIRLIDVPLQIAERPQTYLPASLKGRYCRIRACLFQRVKAEVLFSEHPQSLAQDRIGRLILQLE